MTSDKIEKLKKVSLREVWIKEAKDFTSWLFNNIEILGEELDIDLTAVEKEKKVGSFSADIIAEDGDGEGVLIENQLKKTDHEHLGKLLTYVLNLDVKTAIWISSHPRPEHERVIDWLNESGGGINFYLMKIEAYRIGNSNPAPKFTIITGPSEKTEIIGKEKKKLAKRHKKRLAFWKSLLEKSKLKTSLHLNISPSKYSWIGTGAGRRGLSYNYVITYKYGSIELFIDRGKELKEENKRIFDYLYFQKKEIEKIFGDKLEWQRLDHRRSSRIRKVYKLGLNDKDKLDTLQNNMIDGMIRLEKALNKHINRLEL